MKGLSIFYNGKKLRMHPNAYTDQGAGMALPPFVTLDVPISDAAFHKNIQEVLAQSQSGVPFKMATEEEVKEYWKAFGVRSDRQMGIGVHITREEGRYTVTPIDKRGLFGDAEVVAPDGLLNMVKKLLGLPEGEAARGGFPN